MIAWHPEWHGKLIPPIQVRFDAGLMRVGQTSAHLALSIANAELSFCSQSVMAYVKLNNG